MIKRLFDIVVALMMLVILSPVIFMIAIATLIFIGAPVIFSQQRPGYLGRPFRIYKFRSMNNLVGSDKKMLPDHERLTRFGKVLRSSSLDELPALWNVLSGKMSLVGPRPLLMEYLPLYNSNQARRHEVKPGITGWAQVNGRNAISWDRKFDLDVWYVDNQSLWLDIKILGLTLKGVLRRENISADGHSTMPAFKGNVTDD